MTRKNVMLKIAEMCYSQVWPHYLSLAAHVSTLQSNKLQFFMTITNSVLVRE